MKNRDINTTLSLESYLGKFIKVKIDRPLASRHPEHGFVYCLNYGFIPDIVSGDGEEIDVYVVGEFEAVEAYEGYVVAVIKRKMTWKTSWLSVRKKENTAKSRLQHWWNFRSVFLKRKSKCCRIKNKIFKFVVPTT